jgi:hypothetical protein
MQRLLILPHQRCYVVRQASSERQTHRYSGKFPYWQGIQLNNKHAIKVLTTDMDNRHSKQNDSYAGKHPPVRSTPPAVSATANATVTTWSSFIIHLTTSSNASHILIYINVWTPSHHPKNTSNIFKSESKYIAVKLYKIQQMLWLTVAVVAYITHQHQEKRNLFYFVVLFCVVYCVLLPLLIHGLFTAQYELCL